MKPIEIILQLIAENNITEKKLTQEAGIPHSAITEWKKGNYEPSVKAIVKIADYFDVSVDYLLGRTDDPAPPKRKE